MGREASPVEEARKLLSRARRVKSGDVIMPDDINVLVDVAAKLVEAIEHVRGRGIELIHAVFPRFARVWYTYSDLYEDVSRDTVVLDVEEGVRVYLYTSWCRSKFTVYLGDSVADTVILDYYSDFDKAYRFTGRVRVEVEKGDCFAQVFLSRVFFVDGERRLRVEADWGRKILMSLMPPKLVEAVSRVGVYTELWMYGYGIESIYVNGEDCGPYPVVRVIDTDLDIVMQGHGYASTKLFFSVSELELLRSALVLLADCRDEEGRVTLIAELCEKDGKCGKPIPYYTRPVIRYRAWYVYDIAHLVLLLLESDELRRLSDEYGTG